jgi:hypothetical protein
MGRRVRCIGEANYFIYYKRLGAIAKLATSYGTSSAGVADAMIKAENSISWPMTGDGVKMDSDKTTEATTSV